METKLKKVLIFVPSFPNLTETFIEREVAELAKSKKFNAILISLNKGKGSLSKSSESITVYKRLHILNLLLGFTYIFTKPKRVLLAFSLIKRNPNRSFINTLYLLIKSLGYAKIFSAYKPDIILAHFMSESSTLCLIISKLLGCELAISAHAKDIFQEKGEQNENAELIKEKVANSKFITICNENAYNHVKKLSGVSDPKNVFLKYHGIDFNDLMERFKKAREQEKPNVPVLFSIGRAVEKKGFKYLIGASKILKDKRIEHVFYLVIAEGPLFNDIKQRIEELELIDCIKIIGDGKGMPFDDVLSFYKIADFLIMPSINTDLKDVEGVPNALIEAAFLKIPIVTTDAGSILDFIQPEKEGIIVKQKDSRDLAEGIEKILTSKTLQRELTENASKKAKEMFDISKNIIQLEDLILS